MWGRVTKVALLIATLALPVVLYLFLRNFGENQYQVAIIYEEGITDPLEGCPATHDAQLSDFSFIDAEQAKGSFSEQTGRIYVFSFMQKGCDPQGKVLNEVARVANDFRDDLRVGVISMQVDTSHAVESWLELKSTYSLRSDNWNLWQVPDAPSIVRCGFNLDIENCEAAQQLVLLDGLLRIRGVYQAGDLEEVDRLITELEILLLNEEYG